MAIYNPVIRAQENLARTIQGGLSEWGNRPLERAKISLQEAALLDNIRRNKIADEQSQEIFEANAPVRKLAGMQAQRGIEDLQRQEDYRKTPITDKHMLYLTLGENPSKEDASNLLSNNYVKKILETSGAVRNPDGTYTRKNGQVATLGDLPNIIPVMEMVFDSGSDYGKKLNQKIRQYEDKYMSGKREQAASPEEVRWYEKALKAKNDENWLLNKYQEQNERSSRWISQLKRMGYPTHVLEGDMERRERKIKGLQNRIAEKAKAAADAKKDVKYSDELNRLKYNAQVAYLNGSATPEQIRMYQLDKDAYLGQAAKLVNDDDRYFDLSAEEKVKKIIELADDMRFAARGDTKQVVPDWRNFRSAE